MEPIYLTAEELKAITGLVRKSAQIRWLRENGFTLKVRADGTPLVSRLHYHQVMGVDTNKKAKAAETKPDFDALSALG